jgi:hypothetical protein
VFLYYERQQDKPWIDKEVQNLLIKEAGKFAMAMGRESEQCKI